MFRGNTKGFKHHCCMLLVRAQEMGTANAHSLLPHPKGVILGLLDRKLIHRSAVQHQVYKILNPTPVIVPNERQCFGIVGPVNDGFQGGGGVFGYELGGLWGGWRCHGSGH